jgi:methionyl-tRNA formyltransferase
MKSKIVLVSCTNVGRHFINLFLNNKTYKNIELSGVINLNFNEGLKKSNYDSYYDLKENFNININYVRNINDKNVYKWLKKINPALIIQSGWSQKFSDKILKLPKFGCIGQHPAPLPIGRGAACVNWAIILGYKVWGDTFFIMDEKYDNGDIIGQEKILIEDNDDVKSVYDKICFSSKSIFSKNISNWVKGKFNKKNQNIDKIIYFKKRTPKDGKINIFKENNTKAYNKIRALTKPYPGAFITYKNKKIIIWESKVLNKSIFKRFKNNKRLFFKRKKLILTLGSGTKSYLEIKKLQIGNSPEFRGKNINDYFKLG